MPALSPALAAVFAEILETRERFSLQNLEQASGRHGGGWREARYQLEQWRLSGAVVPANGVKSARVTYWRKK